MTKSFDSRRLRDCFGRFATGVTIITTLDQAGKPVGLTVNSFSSVSLDPPLILWSLDKRSSHIDAFRNAEYHAINVLSAEQLDLSNLFASPKEDRFEGLDYTSGLCGVPLLANCVAWVECKKASAYEGGDHIIFLCEVERFDYSDRPALLFLGGRYGVVGRHPKASHRDAAVPVRRNERPNFNDDFIVPLLRRAFDQVASPFYDELQASGVPVAEGRILSHIEGNGPETAKGLARHAMLDSAQLAMTLHRMEGDKLLKKVTVDGEERYDVTPDGIRKNAEITARAVRFETEILAGHDQAEIDALKSMLRTLIYRSEAGSK
jgi:flavin reductase (DIM6/NTAB) family NADH-FMN oxidoreductase RutF/DNA-binding MarR family transcriptional regulator